jgi:serine/threonine protein kinase
MLSLKESLENEIEEFQDIKQDIENEIEDTDEDDDQKSKLVEELTKIQEQLTIKQEKLKDHNLITPLPDNILLKIFYNILKAMYHLEKLGIGHGDIKPENILINPITYDIQIIDFGLACTDNCKISGTLLYDSPEMLDDLKKNVKYPVKNLQRSDVFSLGLVFYKLANGVFPFDEKELVSTSPFFIVNKLLDYYNKHISNISHIFSTYNKNNTSFDKRINTFIESMLTDKESRPTISTLLLSVQQLIEEYNRLIEDKKKRIELKQTVSPISPEFMTSPVIYSPASPNF